MDIFFEDRIRAPLGCAFREHFVSPVNSQKWWRRNRYPFLVKLYCLYHSASGFLSTRQTSRAPSAKRREAFYEPHEGWAASCEDPLVRRAAAPWAYSLAYLVPMKGGRGGWRGSGDALFVFSLARLSRFPDPTASYPSLFDLPAWCLLVCYSRLGLPGSCLPSSVMWFFFSGSRPASLTLVICCSPL